MEADYISKQLKSFAHYLGTDDSLKDQDNLYWLLNLSGIERVKWLTMLEWVRTADRLLESELFEKGSINNHEFQEFKDKWREFWLPRETKEEYKFHFLFEKLKSTWNNENKKALKVILNDLDNYLNSLQEYAIPEIKTFEEFDRSLYGLSGTFFRCLPDAPEKFKYEIGCLGKLDQFYNNLRDLSEDIRRGINYFPEELLARFNLTHKECLTLAVTSYSNFKEMIKYSLFEIEPMFKKDVDSLFASNSDLPYSWKELIKSLTIRHSRIKRVLISVGFDIDKFNTCYWEEVKKFLELQSNGAK